MKIHPLLAGLMLLFTLNAGGQQQRPKIVAEGGTPDDRSSARVLYWNTQTNAPAGQFAIDYGRPVWKKEYEESATFDAMTRGKIWRMGSNFWSILDTQLPLSIGGKKVPAGFYYLGLHRSEEGSEWSLVFIDPGRVRKARLDAFQIEKAPVEFEALMSVAKAETRAEKLTITLSYPKGDIKHVTMRVAWGNLALSAPIEVASPE
ncbi:MAG: DUF2911 domain-containing protein [Terriglobia bacterium]